MQKLNSFDNLINDKLIVNIFQYFLPNLTTNHTQWHYEDQIP